MKQVKGTINRVELIGWAGGAPDMRTLPSGAVVCNFSVATNRYAGKNEAGERTYEAEWTNVEAWERLAEVCQQYLQKGRRVFIGGSMTTRSWEDRESGQKRYRTVVRASEIMFLDAKPEHAEAEAADEEVAVTAEDLPF